MASHEDVATRSLLDLLTPVHSEMGLVEVRIAQAIETGQAPLTKAYRSLFTGGKRLRPAVALLAAGPEGATRREVIALAAALEMLHTATLIHDDIIDEAPMRRGQPTVSAVHGEDAAILAGDHLFARPAVVVTETGNLEVIRMIAQTLVTISAGEQDQIWRRSRLPSKEEYLRLIHAKTACLFESAALGGALLAGRPPDEVERFAHYGHHLGLAFQIADDVLDYVGVPSVTGKPTLNDLRQGVFTLPVLLYLWQFPEHLGREIPTSIPDEDLHRLVDAVVSKGFVAKALEMAGGFAKRAWESIEGLASGAFAESLEGLTRFAVDRVM